MTTYEDLLAELTTTAYRVALAGGLRAPFLDVELELWRELRAVLERRLSPLGSAGAATGPAAPALRSEPEDEPTFAVEAITGG
jgi:hypothetical protein